MKLVYSLTLSFLLFVFITNLSIAFSNDDNEPILDLSRKPLIAGNEYYILPSFGSRITGGGIELEKTGNSKCEVTVLQSYRQFSFQTSLKFTNLKNSSGQILTNTPLEIEVTKKPDCAHSSKWIVFVDNDVHKSCLGIGDYRNYNNDFQKVSGTFSILKYGKGYQFQFCLDGSGDCYDIGRYHQFGEIGKRLYLAEQDPKDPFEFIFLPTSFETGIIKSVVA